MNLPSVAIDGAGSGITRALQSLAGASPRVWLDIGTSYKSLTKWDVLHNSTLVVVGVDPVKANIYHSYQPATPRFVPVHGACTKGPPGFTTFNMHRSPTCGSLLQTRAHGPRLGAGSDACTGDVPVPTRVPTFPLRMLLHLTRDRLAPRIELLKIDVQVREASTPFHPPFHPPLPRISAAASAAMRDISFCDYGILGAFDP